MTGCMFAVSGKNEELSPFRDQLVDTCISTYTTIQNQLLPTPAKSHYTFNLRDLSKVFQGILMASPAAITVSRRLHSEISSEISWTVPEFRSKTDTYKMFKKPRCLLVCFFSITPLWQVRVALLG